ncbi:hypothetical protein F5050DRAFT_1317386 [Lentinula boryana]|uniref:Secreted protein n=1 Tax=Lentinula boryana TaxID=40481 RepID=A0ABQ8PXC2_9AGAR|nr:hypothetical protein F5050DRAFT_1317386 [Lentinula boryana]
MLFSISHVLLGLIAVIHAIPVKVSFFVFVFFFFFFLASGRCCVGHRGLITVFFIFWYHLSKPTEISFTPTPRGLALRS